MATRGLMGLFDVGNSGLRAARAVMGTTGRNITNASTPGYSKQTQAVSAVPFNGTTLGSVERSQDVLLLAREQLADATRARAEDLQATLQAVEQRLTQSNDNLVDAIAQLFGGFVELAAAPTSTPVRRETIAHAGELAAAFQGASARVAESRAAADGQVSQLAQQANRLASAIAATNDQLRKPDADPALADERDRMSRELASLVGGAADVGSDGIMRFTLDSGHTLVDGAHASTLETTPDAANGGHLSVVLRSGTLTHALGGTLDNGRIGGLLDARDRVLGGTEARIDQLAYDLVSSVNTAHAAGQGLDGNSGRNLFVQPTEIAGAARSMAVEAAVLSDERALATGASGAGPGDNTTARALAALRDARSANGGRTFTDESIDTLSSLGGELARVDSQLEGAQAHSDFLSNLRDARTGVSIEEEMSRLAEMQHAHTAAARFITAVDDAYADLLSRI